MNWRSRLPLRHGLALSLAVPSIMLTPTTVLAAKAPQVILPAGIAELIETTRPLVIGLIVVFAIYVVVISALRSLGAMVSGTGTATFRAQAERPLSIATIVLITIIFLYSFIDIINAVLSWFYNLI